jgi:uncharacterized protein (DUF1778 family)
VKRNQGEKSMAKTPRMTLYIPPELQTQIQAAASVEGLSVSEWVRLVATASLEKKFDPQELNTEVEETPIMQDLILQRLDKFIFDYQIMKERLELIKSTQEDIQKKIEDVLKDNPGIFTMSEEQLKALMEFGKTMVDTTKEAVNKKLSENAKRKEKLRQ